MADLEKDRAGIIADLEEDRADPIVGKDMWNCDGGTSIAYTSAP